MRLRFLSPVVSPDVFRKPKSTAFFSRCINLDFSPYFTALVSLPALEPSVYHIRVSHSYRLPFYSNLIDGEGFIGVGSIVSFLI